MSKHLDVFVVLEQDLVRLWVDDGDTNEVLHIDRVSQETRLALWHAPIEGTYFDLCDVTDFPTVFPVKDARLGARADDAGVFVHKLRLDLLDLAAADATRMRTLFALRAEHDAPDNLNRGIIDQGLQHVLLRRPQRHIDGEALRCYCLGCPGDRHLFGGSQSQHW